jgi:hypothetical protein
MPINQFAREDRINLLFRESMPDGNWLAAFEHDPLAALRHATQIARVQNISLRSRS